MLSLRRLFLVCLMFPSLAWGQTSVINGNRVHAGWTNYGTTAGTATAYTLTFSPPMPGYVQGQCFLFKPHTTNTGAASLNVQGKGALSLTKESGGALVPVVAGDLLVNRLVLACHDGANVQLMGAAPDASGGGLPSDPGPCLSNAFVTDVAQDGTLTCTQPTLAPQWHGYRCPDSRPQHARDRARGQSLRGNRWHGKAWYRGGGLRGTAGARPASVVPPIMASWWQQGARRGAR